VVVTGGGAGKFTKFHKFPARLLTVSGENSRFEHQHQTQIQPGKIMPPKPDPKPAAASDHKDRKNLDLAIQSIVKQYGDNSILRLGDEAARLKIDVIPTGSVVIDRALGVGGFPRGRIIEIFGPESSGKTTLTLTVVAEAQKRGGTAAFIDVEHALDPGYARKLGVNMNELLVSQPDSGEEALTIAETLIRSNAIDVLVIDSVAALVTKNELEGQMGDAVVGSQARLMSQAMRKLTAIISKSKTICIFTNQIREKIGVMFGNPETTPGGKALKFYASVRVDIRRIGAIKQADGTVTGNRTRVKLVKNKVAPPFTEAEFDIMYNEGISKTGSLLDLAIEQNVIEKRGAWLSFEGVQMAQGRDAAKEELKNNADLYARVEKALLAKLDGTADSDPAKKEKTKADAGA
jgi:recombination protein RecA